MTPEQLAASGTEHGHQVALFAAIAIKQKELREDGRNSSLWQIADNLSLMFAIPNGGLRHKAEANKLKSEGVKSGVPDIFLPVAIWRGSIDGETGKELSEQRFHGLFIEMKKPSEKPKHSGAGGVSNKQSNWHTALRAQGYRVAVCYSWQEARDVILQYLGVS